MAVSRRMYRAFIPPAVVLMSLGACITRPSQPPPNLELHAITLPLTLVPRQNREFIFELQNHGVMAVDLCVRAPLAALLSYPDGTKSPLFPHTGSVSDGGCAESIRLSTGGRSRIIVNLATLPGVPLGPATVRAGMLVRANHAREDLYVSGAWPITVADDE